jgi:hypothetical protein
MRKRVPHAASQHHLPLLGDVNRPKIKLKFIRRLSYQNEDPRMNIKTTLALIALFAVSGCATVTVERAKGIASSGKSYVETLKKVNEFALDQSISFSADILPNLPRIGTVIDENTSAVKDRALLIGLAHNYLDGLSTYFTELDALAGGDQSDATGKALGSVIDGLKNPPIGLTISDDRKKALTGLAGFVAKQVHASAVEKALVRDADVIAQALAVSEQMLNEQISWVTTRAEAVRARRYELEVKKPFVAGEQLGIDWKKKWEDAARTPPAVALLVSAKQASSEMQSAWVSVLRGGYSFAELQVVLKNVRDGLEAARVLKESK